MRAYNENFSPLRQSEKQRRSSMIAEMKFGKRDPLANSNIAYNKKKSRFSQEMRMNRYLMKTARFTNPNNIFDYTSTMYEVRSAA